MHIVFQSGLFLFPYSSLCIKLCCVLASIFSDTRSIAVSKTVLLAQGYEQTEVAVHCEDAGSRKHSASGAETPSTLLVRHS
jgi:hypothetical protein